ncbi:hypothetical protein MF271_14785 [Deinococcus sp. KNUC1210]|uniref:hypothetical protein n=1 Tax=Deinococcus sp. KNUC1210 TaxID=2917691 RepID=UPI001EF023E4|nr:hypothetical protein [Deinococcus sp. KNUC1210]ULH15202.1 hypothetical protein MF271_14785 [Deinococcus sp. KNUC1210]
MLIKAEQYRRYVYRESRRKLRPMIAHFLEGVPILPPYLTESVSVEVFIGVLKNFDSPLHFLIQSLRYSKLNDFGYDSPRSIPESGYEGIENTEEINQEEWGHISSQMSPDIKQYLPDNIELDFIDGMTHNFPAWEGWEMIIRTSRHWIRVSYLCSA